MKINEIAEKNYLWVEKMGWHNKTTLEALALVASEVGEAINECRNEKPTDAFGEELADIILRVLDIAYWQGIDMEKKIIDKMMKNEKRGNRGRQKLLSADCRVRYFTKKPLLGRMIANLLLGVKFKIICGSK